MKTYYDEVRDVLDEEGGSDEVVDVDAGFFVEALVVVLPEVLAPPVGERALTSWESTKGLHVRLGMNQVPNPACSLMTRPIEDGKILLCSVFTWRIKRRVELRPKPRDMTEKYTTFVKPNPELLTAAEEEKTTHQHWKGNSIEKTHSSLQGKDVHNATPKPAKQLQPSTYNLTTTF